MIERGGMAMDEVGTTNRKREHEGRNGMNDRVTEEPRKWNEAETRDGCVQDVSKPSQTNPF